MIFRTIIISLLFVQFSVQGFCQKDTVRVKGMIGIKVILQSGNLNQFGFNSNGYLEAGNDLFEAGIFANYGYATINKFNRINDSWNYGILKFMPKNRVYPIGKITTIHAKSFGINSALIGGIGGGVNIIERTPIKRLELNLVTGYGRFDYFVNDNVDGLAFNAYFRAERKILEGKLILDWIFHSYLFPNEQNFFGISSNFRATVSVVKGFGLTFSNLTRYSQVVDTFQKRLNSTTLIGISYKR